MKLFKTYIIIVLTMISALPVFSVTKDEMEKARTITAKTYLRWANDGSGYLDDIDVTTMAALKEKLRPTELENLKAFESVKVPADYQSWDKEKLVEFWGVTFFTSPALNDLGKRGKVTVRKKLMKMSVSTPTAELPAPATPAAPEAPEAVPAPAADSAIPTGSEVAAEQEEILNDQKAIEQDAADAAASSRPREQSHTWIYIVVLVVLILVVVWLVVYAANLMKRQPSNDDNDFDDDADSSRNSDDRRDRREQLHSALADREEEIAALRRRLEDAENRNATLGIEIEKLKLERKRQDDTVIQLREENRRLRTERPAAERPARTNTREATDNAAGTKQILKVIYLGRANKRGIFVRADRRISVGNTIYRLDTNDGLVGTFHVVDEPEVVDTALSNPAEYLGNGCISNDLEDTAGVSHIITESAGTAIFEDGYWKIIRRTRIRYE